MKYLSEALLLLTFQPLTAPVLAFPSGKQTKAPCDLSTQTGCADGEFCTKVFSQVFCHKKYNTGDLCYSNAACQSGKCDKLPALKFGTCKAYCAKDSECSSNFRCQDSMCVPIDQPNFATCYVNDDCHSKHCVDSKCQAPGTKKVGQDCDDKTTCELGSICYKGFCSTRGYKPDGSLGGKCYNSAVYFQCQKAVAYCDYSSAETCQPKKYTGEPCGESPSAKHHDYYLKEQCISGRCVDGGFCGTRKPGDVGDPCSTNEDICQEENECKVAVGNGINAPAKTCQRKRNPDEGKPCQNNGDCYGQDTRCYSGRGNGTCETKWNIEHKFKSCKTEEECGGMERRKVWTNFGAHPTEPNLDGWGWKETDIGFLCTSGNCKWVYDSFRAYSNGQHPTTFKSHTYKPPLAGTF